MCAKSARERSWTRDDGVPTIGWKLLRTSTDVFALTTGEGVSCAMDEVGTVNAIAVVCVEFVLDDQLTDAIDDDRFGMELARVMQGSGPGGKTKDVGFAFSGVAGGDDSSPFTCIGENALELGPFAEKNVLTPTFEILRGEAGRTSPAFGQAFGQPPPLTTPSPGGRDDGRSFETEPEPELEPDIVVMRDSGGEETLEEDNMFTPADEHELPLIG